MDEELSPVAEVDEKDWAEEGDVEETKWLVA